MKNCLVFLAFVLVKSAFGQLNDNFSDGDFNGNPAWTGSNNGNDFVIISDANGNQLRSNSTVTSSNFYLSTPNSLVNNCTWEFGCNLQFNPSGANYVDVYLISDQQNLQNANINGYFVRIGNTDDEISLYRRTGAANTSVKIIDGSNSILNKSNNTVKIKVTRNAANQFLLERDLSGLGIDYFQEGAIVDNTIISGNYFGLFIQQSTLSFVQKHFFNNFKIEPYVADTTPPQLLSATAIDSVTVHIQYNEGMDSIKAKNALNYQLDNGLGSPVSVKTNGNSTLYQLIFGKSMQTADYSLSVSNVTDKAGNNVINQAATFHFTKPYTAKANEVLINEIYADPSPEIDLPGSEFVEIWNTTDQQISLNKWTYSDANTTYTFGNELLQPNEMAIICATADVSNFSTFGKVIGISTWPSLNNSFDQLTLKNANGSLIHQVNYADTWYKDVLKKEGGWSLELINPKAVCSGIQNWSASVDPSGGTPGKANSIYQPNTPLDPLKVFSATMLDSVTLSITFNRYVDSTSAAYISNYQLNNGVGNPASAICIGPYFQETQVKFAVPPTPGKTYTLNCGPISDCTGELLAAPNNSISFFLPEKIKSADLLISEILFNPRLGGVDFVEIHNKTDHPLDLKALRIASLNDQDSLISVKTISNSQNLIEPQSYRVISTNSANIQSEYSVPQPNNLLQIPSMPAFNDDAGVVVLIRSDSLRIDQFNYSEKMHFPLIKDPEGVSLERSSFSVPANAPGNFRSAAASVGFATPGYQNSQYIEGKLSDEAISLESTTLSPDNDGFEDALTIHSHFAQPGLVANLDIYSDRGQLIRRLVKSMTLGSKGDFVWDGLNESSQRVPIGIYLIHLEVFDLSGKVKTFVKPCVVAIKLN